MPLKIQVLTSKREVPERLYPQYSPASARRHADYTPGRRNRGLNYRPKLHTDRIHFKE